RRRAAPRSRPRPAGRRSPARSLRTSRSRRRNGPSAERTAGRMLASWVSHCLLNQNSKVLDGAHCAGVYSPIIDVLRERGWRIEQMPCPELAFAGLGRFWAVREQYDTAAFRRHCQRLATAVAGAIEARVQQGEEIVLVGVEGSPSMGVTITSSDPQRGGRSAWPDGSPE